MTLSIAAYCPRTQQLGVAAATGLAGVGKLLTWVHPRAGAVATQGFVNPYLGIDGLDLLQNGHLAERVLNAVLTLDPIPERRQVGIVDAKGSAHAWTGHECEGWAGHHTAQDFSVQGNLLVSGAPVEATAKSFVDSDDALVTRLMRALEAGVEAGGDRRGERSATVYVMDAEEYPLWDVRVDSSTDPIGDLYRMQELLAEELVSQVRSMPTRFEPRGRVDTAAREGLA